MEESGKEEGKKGKGKSVCEREQEREWEWERDDWSMKMTKYEVCLTVCEPARETEWSLSDIKNQDRHDRVDQMSWRADELVRYVVAGIVGVRSHSAASWSMG